MQAPLIALLAILVVAQISGPRLVWTVPYYAIFWAGVSNDGRYLAYGNQDDGDVYVRDLVAGTSRAVTRHAPPTSPSRERQGFGFDEWAFSPGAEELAYSWRVGDREELRVVSLSGAGINTPRVLLKDANIRWVTARGWSPDGAWIVAGVWRRDRQDTQLAIVSTRDGTFRELRSIPGNRGDAADQGGVVLSADGRYLAYSPRPKDSPTRDVIVVSSATGEQLASIEGPSDDNAVGWSPDGAELVFASDRGGATGLWAMAFADGKPGAMRLIRSGVAKGVDYLGLTSTGSLFYRIYPSPTWQAKTATIDFATGRVVTPATLATPEVTVPDIFPDVWSPDGRLLALVSRGDQVDSDHVMVVRDTATKQSRVVRPKLTVFQSLVWSPDATAFAVRGTIANTRCCGIYRVDVATGDSTLIAAGAEWLRAWSPGGHVLFDRVLDDGTGDTGLIERDEASGAERIVHRWPDGESGRLGVAISPDGKTVYYRTPSRAAAPPHRLIAKDLATGRETELLSARPIGSVAVVAAGRLILTSSDDALMLVPAQGGAPRSVPLVNGIVPTMLAWAEDGTAFVGRTTTGTGSARRDACWWVPLDARPPRPIDLGACGNVGGFATRGSAIAFAERTGIADPPSEVRVFDRLLPARTGRRHP